MIEQPWWSLSQGDVQISAIVPLQCTNLIAHQDILGHHIIACTTVGKNANNNSYSDIRWSVLSYRFVNYGHPIDPLTGWDNLLGKTSRCFFPSNINKPIDHWWLASPLALDLRPYWSWMAVHFGDPERFISGHPLEDQQGTGAPPATRERTRCNATWIDVCSAPTPRCLCAVRCAGAAWNHRAWPGAHHRCWIMGRWFLMLLVM